MCVIDVFFFHILLVLTSENPKCPGMVSKVLPAVQGTCSLLSAKVAYGTNEEDRNVHDRWRNIYHKSDEAIKTR